MSNKTFYNIFNSTQEFFKVAKSVTPALFDNSRFPYAKETVAQCGDSKQGDFNGSWTSTCRKYDEADFIEETALTTSLVDDLVTSDFNEVKWGFQQRLTEGDAVDVERYLAGKERCWTGCKRVQRVKQAVRIYINFGGNCGRSRTELAVSGAVGVTLAEMMESLGVAAEIWQVHKSICMDEADNNYIEMVKVKSQNEYCDFGLVNFMLGDDGVFRNGLFRVNCLHAMRNNLDVHSWLGTSVNADLDDLGLTDEEKRSSVVVPQLFSKDEAKAWLESIVEDPARLKSLAFGSNTSEHWR